MKFKRRIELWKNRIVDWLIMKIVIRKKYLIANAEITDGCVVIDKNNALIYNTKIRNCLPEQILEMQAIINKLERRIKWQKLKLQKLK